MSHAAIDPTLALNVRLELEAILGDFYKSSDKDLFYSRLRELRPSLLGDDKGHLDDLSFYTALHKAMEDELGSSGGIISPLDFKDWDWGIDSAPRCPIQPQHLKNEDVVRLFDEFILVLIPSRICGKDASIRSCFDFFARDMAVVWDSAWCNGKEFADKVDESHWVWIRKSFAPNSLGDTWYGQQLLIPHGEIVPTARQEVCAKLLYFKKNHSDIATDVHVRTCTVDSLHHHVVIGWSNFGQLQISSTDDDSRNSNLGMACSFPDGVLHF